MHSKLLTEFMMRAPIQPATNYWRSIEIDEVIRRGLPLGRGLDLGCGDGHLMSIILSHIGHRELVGLDVDSKETALAAKSQVYSQVITGSAETLPFPESFFDFVFSNSVFEHIYEIDPVLKEVSRVLRPGGRLLFTVPSSDFHRCLKGPLFGNRESYLRYTDARCAHLRYWNLEQWSDHLDKAGLTAIFHCSFLTRSQVQRWELIANCTSGILYGLFCGKKRPIEIQRIANIRTRLLRLPHFLARLCAKMIDVGARAPDSLYGCFMVEANKAE